MSAARLERVGELCRTWVEQDVHKALCVLVARRGVICLHEAFGKLGPHGGPRLERDSIFPLMSITKVVTATALMTLVEDGLVGLTRPVQEYVPEFCGEGKEAVCVHHLLTHTSGLTDEDVQPEIIERWDSAQLPIPESTQHPAVHKQLLLGADVPLSRAPGSEMVYANYNYVLLGEIVRKMSGRSLAEYAAARIFEPLDMKDTSFVLPEAHYPRTIGWSVVRLPTLDTVSPGFRDNPRADGGVHSTAMDTAVLGQMFLNGGSYGDARILGRNTVAEMTRDQIPGVAATLANLRIADASWGYCWGIAGDAKWPGWPTFTPGTSIHSGAGAMLLWVDPTLEIVGVYLCICRYRGTVMEPITNVDLFVNAVNATVED